MVKGCKSLVSSIVRENRNTFETDRECSIRSYKVYGKTVEAVLYEDDALTRWFHIYFNPSKQAAEREQLEQRIDKLRQYLEKHIGQDTKFGKTYQDYFELSYNSKGKLYSVKERSDVVQRELELCGYFCIVTSEKMTAAKALMQYKGRDMSEKLFRADKTFIGSKSNRTHSSESHSAKTFVEFIALIVRNRIYNLLKDTMLKLETSPNYMTVPAALRELEKIEMVRRSSGRYRLDHAVSKRQKIILSAFGLDDMYIRSIAAEIGNLLETTNHYWKSQPRRTRKMARMKSITTIENEIAKTQTELTKTQKKLDALADRLLDLQKEKQDYEARQIIDAYKRSGKTLHEMMIFLGA